MGNDFYDGVGEAQDINSHLMSDQCLCMYILRELHNDGQSRCCSIPNTWCSAQELRQYLVWDIDAEEDCNDTICSTLLTATDRDSDNNNKGKKPKDKKSVKKKGGKSKKRKHESSSSDSSNSSSDDSDSSSSTAEP